MNRNHSHNSWENSPEAGGTTCYYETGLGQRNCPFLNEQSPPCNIYSTESIQTSKLVEEAVVFESINDGPRK